MAYTDEKISEIYNQNLRYLVESRNISKTKLSTDLGFTKNWLSNNLTTKRTPSILIVKKLADYLGVSVDAFFSENIEEAEKTRSVRRKLIDLNVARLRNVETYVDKQIYQQQESKIVKVSSEGNISYIDDYIVVGDSMLPLFANGMIVHVDTSDSKNLIDGMYYAIEITNEIYIKKIVISSDGSPTLELQSLNTGFETTYVNTGQNFRIIGSIHATINI